MLGCFNQILSKIWTNPAIGLHFLIRFFTQWLGLSIFYPKLGEKKSVCKMSVCTMLKKKVAALN